MYGKERLRNKLVPHLVNHEHTSWLAYYRICTFVLLNFFKVQAPSLICIIIAYKAPIQICQTAAAASKINKNEKGIQKLPLSAIWPEGSQNKFP
jgi:hypothetical protein